MKMADAITVATGFLKNGVVVQIVPIIYEDSDFLSASVILPNMQQINKDGLKEMIKIAEDYKCNVYMENNTIVYD